ncbi:MAG: formate dehydrogenase accessory sulfurtransferase FdhD [Desulfatirhabdiaceae bacterium]
MEHFSVIRCENGFCRTSDHELILEEPLLIRVEGKPYSVVMRTPGEEIPHAAGFCLGEGLVDDMNDFATIGFCRDLDPNVVEVRLKPERREKVRDLLERRGFVSQTSCGICGKEMVKDLYQILIPAENNSVIAMNQIPACIDNLIKNQVYYQSTRGSHAAMLLDSRLDKLSFAEDVGRHNALDKAIGKLLLDGRLQNAVAGVVSSRISYELVQKVARAHIPIIISKSRPTALAVEMGKSLNMTLVCADKSSELIIFCGENRIGK